MCVLLHTLADTWVAKLPKYASDSLVIQQMLHNFIKLLFFHRVMVSSPGFGSLVENLIGFSWPTVRSSSLSTKTRIPIMQ